MTLPIFVNSDERLRAAAMQVLERRRLMGLEGLTGGLEAAIICVEPAHLHAAVQELLATTGYAFAEAYEDEDFVECRLAAPHSADLLLHSRKRGANPFAAFNAAPKARGLPNTRLETLVLRAHDLERYAHLQRQRGGVFLSDKVLTQHSCSFLQTAPSRFTGNSIGFVQWKDGPRTFASQTARPLDWQFAKPSFPHLANIGRLDHIATRVTAEHRDPAILEFLEWTDYHFDFAICVDSLNSITNVARLSPKDFALVFTSGMTSSEHSATTTAMGPTERFVANYGPRVHHMAFHTEQIEGTYEALKKQGMNFLVELVGSPEEGLKQTFSDPFEHTMIVNEYIYRYGDFDGFFTKSNVTKLTAATGKQ